MTNTGVTKEHRMLWELTHPLNLKRLSHHAATVPILDRTVLRIEHMAFLMPEICTKDVNGESRIIAEGFDAVDIIRRNQWIRCSPSEDFIRVKPQLCDSF